MSYTLPLIGETNQRFAVNKIICIGRNYADHAREMGHDPDREPPFFFFKPQSALAQNHRPFFHPHFSKQVEHELEFVVALGHGGSKLSPEQASECVSGFGLGLDMTCRDLQKEAKALGRPWELAKGFDGSAPCTGILPGTFADVTRFGEMTLLRNNEVVQRGHWNNMVWSIPELLAEISRYIALERGDLIFTGTPAGVGPVHRGDHLIGTLDGFPEVLDIEVI